jgi:hypothetical protein
MTKTYRSRLSAIVGASLFFMVSGGLAQTVEQRAPDLRIYTTGELTPVSMKS